MFSFERKATYSIVMEFSEKNIMVDGVEGFGEIKEYPVSVVIEIRDEEVLL